VKQSWVIIPAHNEGGIIRRTIQEVREHISRVVVIDDGSRDDTATEAIAAGATVLRHAVNIGQGAALQTGLDYALSRGAQHIFTFDADGQHAPESLGVLWDALLTSGADVALGSRTLGRTEGMPLVKKIVLKAAVAFTRLHTGLSVTDTHNGLRLFTRRAASQIQITQARMAHASEILSQIRSLGLHFVEAPVTIRYTEYSLKKGQPVTDALHILLDIFYTSWTK
jgi:glycosyltransferase involved in cell wall biosynthesis